MLKPEAEYPQRINKLLNFLDNQLCFIDYDRHVNIHDYIVETQDASLGSILLSLFNLNYLEKIVLIRALTENDLGKPDQVLINWWEQEKAIFCSKALPNSSPLLKKKPIKRESLLNNPLTEKFLIEQLEKRIIKFSQENFYIYRYGNTYHYSIYPNDESFGGRCDIDGNPLRDEYGNAFTDEYGNFRYMLPRQIDDGNGNVREIKTIVSSDTPGAVPLTDDFGVALSGKYRYKVNMEKPKRINKKKAEAVNYLLQKLKIVSAEQIYEYINSPYFKDLIREEQFNVKFWAITLSSICSDFCRDYEEIVNMKSDQLTLDFLLDGANYFKLSSDEFEHLFFHHNPFLIAKIIIDLYEDRYFAATLINYDYLLKFINNDRSIISTINEERCENKLPLILPENSRSPVKDTAEDEKLTTYQLFQYDDKTVAAVEECLREKFQNLIINSSCEFSPEKLLSSAPLYFYQLPANSYMLLDQSYENSPSYARFEQFKQDIRKLVLNSHTIQEKPIIFFGMINVFTTHYIPYFIYKNDKENIQIIVVDSSPKISSEKNDSKILMNTKLKNIFESIFSNCDFYDPMITQMLRERDCGPNSAQTLFDGLQTATSSNPLIYIDENGRLQINIDSLTLNSQPNGFNHYTGTYTYPLNTELNTNKNRHAWEQRLCLISTIHYPIRQNDQELSVIDNNEVISEEYSYRQQVDSQTLADAKNNTISFIQSLLLSDEAGRTLVELIIDDFKNTLKLTYIDQLKHFFYYKTDEEQRRQYTFSHKNLDELFEDVVAIILHDHIYEALLTTFQSVTLKTQPDRTDLNAQKIVDDFLSDVYSVYKKLSPREQSNIKISLIDKAKQAVSDKLVTLHSRLVTNLFQKNLHDYIRKIDSLSAPCSNEADLKAKLLNKLSQLDASKFFIDHTNHYSEKKIEESINYLKLHAYPVLKSLLSYELENLISIIIMVTLGRAKKEILIDSKSTAELLNFYDKEAGNFISLDPNSYLVNNNPSAYTICLDEITTVIGKRIVKEINLDFQEEIKKLLMNDAEKKAIVLTQNSDFLSTYTNKTVNEINNLLDDADKLIHEIDFSQEIAKYGDDVNISDEYLHPILKPYIQSALTKIVQTMLISLRNKIYVDIGSSILQLNKSTLTLSQFSLKDDLQSELTSQLISQAREKSNDLEKAYIENFTCEESSRINPSEHFHQYFSNTYTEILLKNYHQALKLKNFITTVLELIEGLDITRDHSAKIYRILSNCKDSCVNQQTSLETIILFDEVDEFFDPILLEIESKIHQAISTLIRLLLKTGYKFSEITPGSPTEIIRPFLCTLLNIETPTVLTDTQAAEIDRQITNKSKNFNSKPLNVLNHSSLITLKPVLSLPNTINVELTPNILLQFVSYWYTNRTLFTHLQFLMEENHLPPVLVEIINLINAHENLDTTFNSAKLIKLKYLLNFDLEENLNLLSDLTPISKVHTALLTSKDFSGELNNETGISFAKMTRLLRGDAIDSIQHNPNEKFVISRNDFNQLVQEIYNERIQINENVSIDQVKTELLSQYRIFEKTPIALTKFNALLTTTLLEENRKIKNDATELKNKLEDQGNQNIAMRGFLFNPDSKYSETKIFTTESDNQIEIHYAYFNQQYINTNLLDHYEIKLENAEDNNEDFALLKGVYFSKLQRPTIQSMGMFGRTSLDRDLDRLKARHSNGDDQIDEYDLKIFQSRLKERWDRLCKEKGPRLAAQQHYFNKNSNYQDNSYYVMADILARYFRKKGNIVFIHDLLMPGYFLSSEKLKEATPPKDFIKKLSQVAKDTIENSLNIYNADTEVEGEDLDVTLDAIPLSRLITTRSGYAFDFNWILDAYIYNRKLVNSYTDEELTEEEIDDILAHSKAKKLIDRVLRTCVPILTPHAIDLLEEYIIGTTFQTGFHAYYEHDEKVKSRTASEVFYSKLNQLPYTEKLALLNTPIPKSRDTVGSILSEARTSCITYAGVELAKVVIRYKRENNIPDFIKARIISIRYHEENSEFIDSDQNPPSSLEEYILRKMDHQSISLGC